MLTYDNGGRLLSRGSSTYAWNELNQLTATSDGGGSFVYDAFGRRISRTMNGATTSYLHDGINPVQVNNDFMLSGGVAEVFARVNAGGVTSFMSDALGSTLGEHWGQIYFLRENWVWDLIWCELLLAK